MVDVARGVELGGFDMVDVARGVEPGELDVVDVARGVELARPRCRHGVELAGFNVVVSSWLVSAWCRAGWCRRGVELAGFDVTASSWPVSTWRVGRAGWRC
jgi:hypothetical protein